MRGKQRSTSSMRTDTRNIPAYAGKTFRGRVPRRAGTEHPRVCGENGLEELPEHHLAGTSPRMRGKLPAIGQTPLPAGNIPAYAGKTRGVPHVGHEQQEHPRVCGENSVGGNCFPVYTGTSPRMRGKQSSSQLLMYRRGNIPAYAGKTTVHIEYKDGYTEHPRVCGENEMPSCLSNSSHGTSPRMRGKRFR